MEGLKAAIRVSDLQDYRRRRFPSTWSVKRTLISHSEVGGVTNGEFSGWLACAPGVKLNHQEPMKGLSNTLGQVLDPTERQDRWVKEPEDGAPNTGKGLLEWSKRSRPIVSPSVFRKDKWALRKLNRKELSNVLDFPATRFSRLTEVCKERLIAREFPGKVWTAALEPMRLLNHCPDVDSLGPRKKKPRAEEHSPQEGWALHQSMKQTSEVSTAPKQSTVTDKATKADNAAVPVHLWNDRIANGLTEIWQGQNKEPPLNFNLEEDCARFRRVMDWLRTRLLTRWRRRVTKSFVAWFKEERADANHKEKLKQDGARAVAKAANASWWNWDKGSATFFWRWPPHYREAARIGVAPFFDKAPPENQDQQPPYSDECTREMVKAKLSAVMEKGYIERTDLEQVEAMMFMFHVPKGTDDIRMVYDGSKSGLNEALWAPWFALPTIDSMARWVVAGSWLADNDYGEQFLNFPLHPDLQKYCGVDLTQLFPEWACTKTKLAVGRWTRNAMGLKPSPYNSVQGALVAKFMLMGDPKQEGNPFEWNHIRLNLPGSENYDATLPWIMKVRKDGRLASGIAQYIDDVRIYAASKELAWKASSKVAKGLCFLGLQDAARKRRESTQSPGAWAGAVVSTENGAFKSVTQERWEKTQSRIRSIGLALGIKDEFSDVLENPFPEMKSVENKIVKLNHKALERAVGFLVYVSMTYTMMKPYLKGIYLTLNSWRPGRDDSGWRTKGSSGGEHGPTPESVKPVPRLVEDIKALMELTRHVAPPRVPFRASIENPTFMVGDASGLGFGVSKWRQGSKTVEVTHGNWALRVTLDESSNFREASNLTQELLRMVEVGYIRAGSEVWLFTDNSTAESTFYKGGSSSKALHELVLNLKKIEMEKSIIIHFVWFSGERMISQGTDGLSRGDLTSGVMAGIDFLKYIPLNETALERQPGLCTALKSWLPGKWKVAAPEDWFYEVRKDRATGWIWAPPPCLARVALEELCEVKHMLPDSKHVFICPALMTGLWRKPLRKICDAKFSLTAGSTFWDKEQFEPLTIAFICPLLHRYPWKVGRLASMEAWESKVLSLQWQDRAAFRTHMRKLWSEGASGQSM